MDYKVEILLYELILLIITGFVLRYIFKWLWAYFTHVAKPEPISLGIGGKWGSYIKLKDMNHFAASVMEGDFIYQ